MKRWNPAALARPFCRFAIVLLAAHALLAGAWGQIGPREFPRAAVRGTLVVTQPPEIRMDGKADRLSPGARIRGTNNLLVMSGAIVGQELTVNYVRDAQGQVHEVWVLTPEEVALRRANMRENFRFGSETEKPAGDDGKTPYNQLPGYGAQPNR